MGDHYVDVVNENDEIIGKDLKSLKPDKGFISRVVAIFIIDSEGKFLVCKRAAQKTNAASLYDLAAFGNVISGESYEDAAHRELHEELNISSDLKILDKFYQEVESNGKIFKIFCGVFIGKSDEKPSPNYEISEFKKMSFYEIEEELQARPENFCSGFVNDFNQVKPKLKELDVN